MSTVPNIVKLLVKSRVQWTFDQLKWLHHKRKLPAISYFDNDCSAGYADIARNEVQFNSILLLENVEEFIRVIVPHEVVHLVDAWVYKSETHHGANFNRLMKMLNLPRSSVHHFDTDRCPQKDPDVFVYRCKCVHSHKHEVTGKTHALRQVETKTCTTCLQPLQFSHIRQLRKSP